MINNNQNNNYPSESVGRRMVNNIPICNPWDKVSEIKNSVFKKAQDLETINYIYVIDNEKLVGVFSLKEIFRRNDGEKAEDFMDTEVIKINPKADQEKVVALAIKYKLKAIPVVNKDNFFLGVVPSDVILDILHKEHIEDIFISAGLHKKNEFSTKILEAPVKTLVKIRIPWLITGLLGGLLAANITIFFEEPLKSYFILASFIPLIAYMSGAVASQTQVLYIRSLSSNHLSKKKYFLKEIKTGLLMGIVLSFILFNLTFLISRILLVSFILGVSLFLTILSAIVISIFIIEILSKLGKDPALGSGPFGTILADISSLLIYFMVATFLLSFFS